MKFKQYKNSMDLHNDSTDPINAKLKTKRYSGEELPSKNTDSEYLPKIHITPMVGLINDPNGMHQDKDGNYNIYYQLSPFFPGHYMKHWGLVKTKDWVNFEDKGIIISPDRDFDKDGVYSGAAYSEGEKDHIFYTGNLKSDDGLEENFSATSVYFDKENNEKRLLFEVDKTRYTRHFRDPAPYEQDGNKYLLHGAQLRDGLKGSISVYESNEWNGDWTLKGELEIQNLNDPGYMLECPNLINIDGKDLFLFSVQGSDEYLKYLPIDIVVYGIGKADMKELKYTNDGFTPLDYGFDYYAPQLFRDRNDRVIIVGWMGNGQNLEYMDANDGYNGCLTLPREVSIVDNKLIQYPLNEIKEYFNTSISLNDLSNKTFWLDINEINNEFNFTIENNEGEKIVVSYNNKNLTFDRTNTSKGETNWILKDGTEHPNVLNVEISDLNELSIIVDHSTIELYANKGEKVFSSRFYISNEWNVKLNNDNYKLMINN